MARSSTSGLGRPKGALNKATRELKDVLGQYDTVITKELVRLCQSAENEATRVSAIKEFNDRRYGKAHQTSEVTITRQRAVELTDDELAGIVSDRRSGRATKTPGDQTRLH